MDTPPPTSDTDPNALELSYGILDWLSAQTSDLEFPHSNKSFIASALHYGAIDHFNAICYLVKAGAHSSAFALLRVEWQAFINGLWMQLVCPEDQAEKYWVGDREFPGLEAAIKQVMKNLPEGAEGGKGITTLKVQLGKSMHIYTHMGALQIQGLTRTGEIASYFPAAQVDALLTVAVRIALYAATGLAWLKDDAFLEAAIEDEFLDFFKSLKKLGEIDVP